MHYQSINAVQFYYKELQCLVEMQV